MDEDDRPIGRILSRREVLSLFGAGAVMLTGCSTGQSATTGTTTSQATTASGANATTATSTVSATRTSSTATAGSATSTTEADTPTAQTAASTPTSGTPGSSSSTTALPACVVVPALTEGPYFVDEKLNRADIRTDPSDGTVKPGAPLALTFRISQVGSGSCTPLAGASVDVWQCDALGVYSDVSDPTFNTKGKKFLRGYQVTDAAGTASFLTIYPGWYQGRAVHIHFKIRNQAGSGSAHEFTSQLFFDDTLTDQVYAQQPYAQKGQRTTRNANDGIYRQSNGQTLLTVTRTGDGYAGTFDVGLQLG